MTSPLCARVRVLSLVCSQFVALMLARLAQWSRASRNCPHPRRSWYGYSRFRRFACLAMVMVLALQVPASPQVSQATAKVISATAVNSWQEGRFWWHSSGWAARAERLRNGFLDAIDAQTGAAGKDGKGAPRRSRPAPRDVETQQDREQRVARIKIFPGDVEIKTGEQIVFNAIAFDQDDNAVNGLEVKWSALHEEKNHQLTFTSHGAFVSGAPGKFIVTAEIAGHKERVKVTVTGEARRPGLKGRSETPKSSRQSRRDSSLRAPISDDQKQIAKRSKRASGKPELPGLRAASAPMAARSAMVTEGDPDGWHQDNHDSATLLKNKRGEVSGHAIDGGVGSSSFQFAAPAAVLDGRGIDLNLLLNYNSRVWHKAGSEMTFDIDRDWPAPGWTLGFGKIVMAGDTYMFIGADGTRHPYNGTLRRNFAPPLSSLQTFEAHTTDGTFINYYCEGYQAQFDNSNGKNMVMCWAVMPDGTRIEYGAKANYAMYPTKITDKHGNFINITYLNNEGPKIQSIMDPLGRAIQFHYDVFGLLTAISVPGLGGGSRVALRLQYQWHTLSNTGPNYGFAGGLTTKVRQSTIPLLRAIYYPGTGTGYWFGDPDSYSPYGMLRKLSERRGMTFDNAPLYEQGNIGAGLMSREMVYNYPQSGGSYSDMPTYTQMTEDWVGRTTASAPVTQFSVVENGSTQTTTITRPDGAELKQITDNNQSSPTYGMLLEDTLSQGGTTLSRSKTFWEIGAYESPRPWRTEMFDELNRRTATTYSYDPAYGSIYNTPSDVRALGYSDELLRRTHTEYLNTGHYNGSLQNSGMLWWKQGGGLSGGPYWQGSHIFNLVSLTEVYGPDDVTRLSRTERQYDGGSSLINTPGIIQHNSWYNPYTPDQVVCEWVPNPNDQDCMECPPPIECPFDDGFCSQIEQCVSYPQYDWRTGYRGNVTQIKSYADAVNLDQGTAVVETLVYDVAGNLREQSSSCCEKTTIAYTTNTQYAWAESQISGSPSEQSKQNKTSATYDYSTGLVNTSTDVNGRIADVEYDFNTLRAVRDNSSTDAYESHVYDDLNLRVEDYIYEAGKVGSDFASRSDIYLDGRGSVIKEVSYGKNGVKDVVETKFDNLGRVSQESRPYRANGDLSPAEPVHWSAVTYDALNRPIQSTSPDNSVITRAYNQSPDPPGSSGQPGQTVKVTDPWGRQRWMRSDALGRLVEVAEPNANGSGALSGGAMYTTYISDALGRLQQAIQGNQTRHFRYDSLGRMTHQKLAERDATLNDSGQWVGGGFWSDVFFYDTRSNLIRRVDARGVQTHYNFNDPLNRLLGVSYDKSGTPGHISANIPDSPNVSYSYMTTGDKMRGASFVVSNGMGNEQLSYDSEGRLAQVRRTFTGRESYPMLNNYLWDSVNRLMESTDPQQYGAGDIRKKTHPTYDNASRVESLKFGGVTYAANPVYNASSQVTSLDVGSQIKQTYNFDPKTGLMTNQQMKRGAETLVDLKYNYTLNNDPNNNGAKTGQLTGVTDLKNQARNQAYEYDKLGRLVKFKSGVDAFSNPSSQQGYIYDRYGNNGVNGQPGGQPIETVWFDDALPAGAVAGASGGDSWNWVSTSPTPQSGSVSHISNLADWADWSPAPYSGNVSHQSNISSGLHQHYFVSTPWPFPVRQGGKLYTYVYLDPKNPPQELMLQWESTSEGWNHRAYWGANMITNWGADGTTSRRPMGPLPAAGGWVRLEVTAAAVGLEGKQIKSMAFTLYGGRANFDLSGVEGVNVWSEWVCVQNCDFGECYEDCNNVIHEDYENYVMVDDSIPLGSTPGGDGEGWNWRGANNVELIHQHYFDNASNTLQVNAGDTMFAWVYLDPAKPPEEVMLQWKVNEYWEYRAYWGANKIEWGADGTRARRYMGALPAAGGWVKLQVPASVVELEGKVVNGMAFTLYGGRAAWDKTGKTSGATPAPPNPVMGLDGFNNLTYTAVNNRIVSPGFAYDYAGNQTNAVIDGSGTQQQYRYDCANRLVQVLNGSGNVLATHEYGASNQRLKSVEGGVTKYFAWSAGKIVAEYEAFGANGLIWKMSYVYLGGRLLATTSGVDGNETRFHHPDRLGTRLVTAADGTVVSEQWTRPFGNMQPFTSVPGGENPYQHPTLANPSKKRFTTYDRSEATGLDYAVNRFYSPQQGRFTQVDPIGMSAVSLVNPQTLNMYTYCANDPINCADPDGLFFGKLFKWIGRALKWIGIAVAVAVVVMSGPFAPAAGSILGKILGVLIGIGKAVGMGANFLAGGALVAEGATLAAAQIGAAILIGAGTAVGAISKLQQQGQDPPKCNPAEVLRIARKNIGQEAWKTDKRKVATKNKKIAFNEGDYKCNLFVYEVLLRSNAPAPTSGGHGEQPAQAADWALKADTNMEGWEVVNGPPRPGDIVSVAVDGPTSTGHVAVVSKVGRDGKTGKSIGTSGDGTIEETDFGFRRDGQFGARNAVTFRRCTGRTDRR